MRGKYPAIFLLSLLFVSMFIIGVRSEVSTTRMYVDPQKVTGEDVGHTFNVSIIIENAVDLFTYEFKLSWTGSILNVTDVVEGDFPSQGGVFNTVFVAGMYNGVGPLGSDYVYVVSTLYAKSKGEDGGGVLATITFTVETTGETILDLNDIMILDSLGFKGTATWEDGYFVMTPRTFRVDPSSIIDSTMITNTTFSVNITLSNASDVYGLRFTLGYNQTLLNATQAFVTPFLDNPQNQTIIDNDDGYIWVYSNSTTPKTVSNTRTVANVTFKVLEKGSTTLDLLNTMLNDSISQLSHTPPFEHTPPGVDGYFSNIPIGHNIAISRVRLASSEAVVGEKLNISVTVKNTGGFNETFHVTLYYDGNFIENRTNVSLEAATQDSLIFDWDTTGVSAGVYTIKAQASTVQNETNTKDNVNYSTSVTIKETSGPDILEYLPYIGAVVIIAIIVVVVYFVKFRKP